MAKQSNGGGFTLFGGLFNFNYDHLFTYLIYNPPFCFDLKADYTERASTITKMGFNNQFIKILDL